MQTKEEWEVSRKEVLAAAIKEWRQPFSNLVRFNDESSSQWREELLVVIEARWSSRAYVDGAYDLLLKEEFGLCCILGQ